MFQKTGFMDDSFEAKEGVYPSTHFPPPPSTTEEEEQPAIEVESGLKVKSRLKSKSGSDDEKASQADPIIADPLLDPLLACMPGMQLADADMAKFLGESSEPRVSEEPRTHQVRIELILTMQHCWEG